MITDRKTISIMKACELVGVSRRTIYNWIASGKVEYIRTAGGSVRIFVDTLWREPGERASSPAKKRHDPGRRFENHEESVDDTPERGLLFHRLNNQLGIILANAELLEAKAGDEMTRARGVAGRGERARRDGDRAGDSASSRSNRSQPNIWLTWRQHSQDIDTALLQPARNFTRLHIPTLP